MHICITHIIPTYYTLWAVIRSRLGFRLYSLVHPIIIYYGPHLPLIENSWKFRKNDTSILPFRKSGGHRLLRGQQRLLVTHPETQGLYRMYTDGRLSGYSNKGVACARKHFPPIFRTNKNTDSLSCCTTPSHWHTRIKWICSKITTNKKPTW